MVVSIEKVSLKKHIPSLNGLRALSILLVIAFHFNLHHFFSFGKQAAHLSFLLFNGPLAVNVFFVISGFLITSLLINENEKHGKISLKNFYTRRIIRIFPAYYFLLLIYFVLQFLGYVHFSLITWIYSLTYTNQFAQITANPMAHLWSLSVEEMFYLLWPFIFINSGKYLKSIIVILIIIILGMRVFNFAYPLPNHIDEITSTGDALLIGCLFAITYESICEFLINWKLKILIFLVLFFSVVFYGYVYYLAGHTDSFFILKILMPLSYAFFGNIGLITNLCIGLLIIYSINIKNAWFTFLNLPVMDYIGKLSYSLYLWQDIFSQDRDYLHKLPFVLLLLFIFLCAAFSYYVIEKPFLLLKRRFESDKH